ncbi:MAG TPA: hypothetical protein VIY51_05090 [Xanthobacteraceae bacterium]
MPILDLYSSRNAQQREAGDVWDYDSIPDVLRVQVSNIIRGALGLVDAYPEGSAAIYGAIRKGVAHEHGLDWLVNQSYNAADDVQQCLRTTHDTLLWLDLVELAFRYIVGWTGRLDKYGRETRGMTISWTEAIEELNERFRRAGFGYRYERGKIIRVDSELIHQEATRPALALLSDPRFAGADQEFRAAHDHYKAGEYKDCAVDALNALESTMKAICDTKGWAYQKGARASDLIKVLRSQRLFPEFADASFDQLLSTLKSAFPPCGTRPEGMAKGRPRSGAWAQANCSSPQYRFANRPDFAKIGPATGRREHSDEAEENGHAPNLEYPAISMAGTYCSLMARKRTGRKRL